MDVHDLLNCLHDKTTTTLIDDIIGGSSYNRNRSDIFPLELYVVAEGTSTKLQTLNSWEYKRVYGLSVALNLSKCLFVIFH